MRVLQLPPIGEFDAGLLQDLGRQLRTFRVACEVATVTLDPEFAYHGERQQYHCSEILQMMQQWRLRMLWSGLI